MRKRVITPVVPQGPASLEPEWLDVEELARVEVTSEDPAQPIESALVPGEESGWRAALPGEQTIRLVFDRPQRVSRMWLLFIEPDTTRTQEFVLRWSPDGGRSFREILRQQWNFGPPETIREA
ncbi:MAG TPA: carbohydrate-binding protein, partial [Vicinamibacteria bacterium]